MNLPADHDKNYPIKPRVMDIQYILTLSLARTATPFLLISIPVTALLQVTSGREL